MQIKPTHRRKEKHDRSERKQRHGDGKPICKTPSINPNKFCLTCTSRKATGRLSAAVGDTLAVLEGNMGEDDDEGDDDDDASD